MAGGGGGSTLALKYVEALYAYYADVTALTTCNCIVMFLPLRWVFHTLTQMLFEVDSHKFW